MIFSVVFSCSAGSPWARSARPMLAAHGARAAREWATAGRTASAWGPVVSEWWRGDGVGWVNRVGLRGRWGLGPPVSG